MNLNQDKVPCDLDEAVDLLREGLTAEELEYVAKIYPPNLHFHLGMYIRNEWSLWESDTILVKWFERTYGLTHADDISMMIIECLACDLLKQKRNERTIAEKYLTHWK